MAAMDLVKHFLSPVFVIGADHDHVESVLLAFHPDALGIIDVQIDAESRGILRRRAVEPVIGELVPVACAVDDSVNPNTVEIQPEADAHGRMASYDE